jgi:alkyl hydroperoxide reductase subunit AhpF
MNILDLMDEKATPCLVSEELLDVEYLIVGMGPAGASLACFLAYHGK